MRSFALCAFVVLVSTTATARTIVDEGPVAVHAEFNSNEGCDIGVDEELCGATWDDGGAAGIGDDRVSVNKSVDEVAIHVRVAPLPARSVTIQPRDLAVEHPGFDLANDTWAAANSSRPAAVRDAVAMESRFRETGFEYDTWGLVLAVDGLGSEPSRFWIVCWDLMCGFFSTGGTSSDGRLALLPGGLTLEPWDSDEWLENDLAGESTGDENTGLLSCWSLMRNTTCPEPVLAVARSVARPAVTAAEEATPQVVTFATVNKTTLRVGPDGLPPLPNPAPKPGADDPVDNPLRSLREQTEPSGPPRALGSNRGAPVPREELRSAGGATQETASLPSLHEQDVIALPSPVAVVIGGLLLLGLVLAGLFARLRREDALEHAARKAIYEEVCREPGVLVGTLASRLALSYPTTRHHVKVLESFGLVKLAGSGQRGLLPVGSLRPQEEQLYTGVLANPSARRICEVVASRPEIDILTVARKTDLRYSTAAGLIAILAAAGVVEKRRVRRRWLIRRGPASPVGRTPASGADASMER